MPNFADNATLKKDLKNSALFAMSGDFALVTNDGRLNKALIASLR